MKIGIRGYYGFGNFGDELFLETFKQVFHPHKVFPLISPINKFDCDRVIVGGGDLIIPYSFNSAYFPKELLQVKSWVYGVGIVDFYPEHTWSKEEVNKYREIISNTEGLYVRDANSKQLANNIELHKSVIQQVPDIAFSYKQPKFPIMRNPHETNIGFCPFAYKDFPINKMTNILAAISKKKNFRISIISVVDNKNKYSDLSVCNNLMKKILKINPSARISVVEYKYLDVTYSYIQSLDFLISFKLHPSLVAIRNMIPTFCLSKLSKVTSLLNEFNIIEFYSDYDAPQQQIHNKIEDFLKNGPKKMSTLGTKIKSVEKLSDDKIQKLKAEVLKAN
ncbi:polysaccharide pyruvyl transferase family protein [Sutcliffiella cohnii]